MTGTSLRAVLISVLGGVTASLCVSASALAAIPEPRLKPPNAAAEARLLQGADYEAFSDALAAGRKGDWPTQARLQQRVRDPLARNVLAWQRAAYWSGASYDTLTHVSQALGDWPRMVSVRAQGEKKLAERAVGPTATIAWFQGREPVSGEGRIALARAYFDLGDRDKGLAYLRSGWREAKLTRDFQRDVFREYAKQLTADDHAARIDHLIWQGRAHRDKARALLPYVDADRRALLEARLALAERRANVNAKINAVPESLRETPELQYERARWRRAKLSDREASLEPLFAMDAPVASEAGREAVWREKKIQIYYLFGEGRFADAYRLTQHHGLTDGLGFQEAEFLAGWLSLRKLGEAERAERHFRTLYDGVSRSISKARGAYWTARAMEARGDSRSADAFYAAAAGFPNTYYGQLAAERTNQPLVFPPDPEPPANVDQRLVAMRMLAEARQPRLVETFAFHIDGTVPDVASLVGLAELADELDVPRASVRAAKEAARFGELLTEVGYPMPVSITGLDARRYDIPFTLAIARQESEFGVGAVSSARAYGMMQMIDATARSTARKHSVGYSRERLLYDETYAAQLGSLHLNDLLELYDGSYVLAAVAYNAGPTRARRWIGLLGDPRGEVDPIDWVEMIPFSETRNYVQRVMENRQVYLARLNGDRARASLWADLGRGRSGS